MVDIPRIGARDYSLAERVVDGVVHALGIAAAVVAIVVLVTTLATGAEPRAVAVAAVALYAVGLLAMPVCSALYNSATAGRWKARLQRLDHTAIFAMIAGTYSPVALLGIGGAWGWSLFGAVWTGAVSGAVARLVAPGCFARISVAAYLVLGWAGLAAAHELVAALPVRDLVLLVAGGLLYSLGVLAHLATALRYHDALWHLLVTAGAACHFIVVLGLADGAA
jgi:hemolysin III